MMTSGATKPNVIKKTSVIKLAEATGIFFSLRHIHAEQKRKISLMFVIYSLILFVCFILIFFAFVPAFTSHRAKANREAKNYFDV